MRSRFALGRGSVGLRLLAACTDQFGAGITELPRCIAAGSLPIGDWVVNDGLEPRTIVYCPRDACAHQAMAALISLEGKRADEMERALADGSGPPRPRVRQALDSRLRATRREPEPKDTAPKSTTSVCAMTRPAARPARRGSAPKTCRVE